MAVASRYILHAVILVLPHFAVQTFQFQPSIAFRRLPQHNAHLSRTKRHIQRLNAAPPSSAQPTASRNKRRPSKKKRSKRAGNKRVLKEIKNPSELETWRVYSVEVNPDALGESLMIDNKKKKEEKEKESIVLPAERSYLTPPVLSSLLSRLRIRTDGAINTNDGTVVTGTAPLLPSQLKDARVVRRSLDARRRRGADPKYTYVIDVTLTRGAAHELKFSHQPGRMERMKSESKRHSEDNLADDVTGTNEATTDEKEGEEEKKESNGKPKIVIIGAGPAGLFCALSLASSGLFTPVLLERGQPVEARGKSIGALIHRRNLDPNSNFSFGEGGAGTWSDGKLTTRIGRNSGPVRFVLETLVKYGAPERILVEGAPHLGTDNLVRLLRNMRQDLISMGGEIHFGACVNKFHIDNGVIKGVDAKYIPETERTKANGGESDRSSSQGGSTQTFYGDAFVLATGHSARDIYYELHKSGVELEPKGFAVGFRIEHPQRLINEIQYGKDWGDRVFTRRLSTDAANKEHFAKNHPDDSAPHVGTLPVAAYRLATNEAWDGVENRGAYSFCQCPGGQIVPSSTEDDELCINGMSFSKRDSLWANSALVVTVNPDDPILEKYPRTHGCLAGLAFQRDMERKAYNLGGGGMRAPVQRLTDFVNQKVSEPESLPQSSYRLGVKSAPCHDIYPQPLYNALVHAITHNFEKQMPGFLCEEALLHGVETRTSSPVRVLRDSKTLQASGIDNMFPSGEGAGFAGGIVSAAVDGLLVANAIKAKLFAHDKSQLFKDGKQVSVGFDY
mmetsp:Transcript_19156/g.40363  ORF Transcript_19156/g.40363 Transcript_19156/m.40363 type:complete len:789 (-) Transcript_19156:293-2659(-)